MAAKSPNFLLMTAILSLVIFPAALVQTGGAQQPAQKNEQPPASAAEIAAYEKQLAEYNAAREPFEKAASAYWQTVADKRKIRTEKRGRKEAPTIADYLLTQPPVYTGPPQPTPPPGLKPIAPPKYVTVIADFLKNAESEFQFKPDRPATELQFKRAYAKAAVAAGLTKDQIVRIYAFETGGNAGYDLQAGFESKKPDAHAVSTALGYNQLLHANTIELLADKGERFVAALQAKAKAATGNRRRHLQKKIETLQRMIAFARSVPDEWTEHVRIASTPQGLGIHSLNLDIDVGPLLQVENLATSVAFARRNGLARPLTAAELEMMNLTGDGNGFDIVVMPNPLRDQVPTSNFFERNGYEANPVVIRNNTVAKLLSATNAEMDENSLLPGAKSLAAVY
jgi:hypothetical protein